MDSTAAIIVIGNEILSGKVRDENGPFLVTEMRELGLPVCRIHVIPDDVSVIAATVRDAASLATFVFTCGGVGPTLDDVTFEGVARAFDEPLVRHPELAQIIRDHLGDGTTESHLKMADVPNSTELIRAEGLPWPAARVRNVMVFPGSPELVRVKWQALRERFRQMPFVLRRVFTTLDEGLVAPHLDAIAAAWPEVDLGSYPLWKPTDYSVQVTLEGKDEARVESALKDLLDRLDSTTIVRVE